MSNWIYRSQGNCTQFRGVRWVGRSFVRSCETGWDDWIFFLLSSVLLWRNKHIIQYIRHSLAQMTNVTVNGKTSSMYSVHGLAMYSIYSWYCLFVGWFLFWFFHTHGMLYFYHSMAFKWAARGSLTFSHHLISHSLTQCPPLSIVPPKIDYIAPSTRVDVSKGASIKLECRATGNPPPKLVWTRKVCTQNSPEFVAEFLFSGTGRYLRHTQCIYKYVFMITVSMSMLTLLLLLVELLLILLNLFVVW